MSRSGNKIITLLMLPATPRSPRGGSSGKFVQQVCLRHEVMSSRYTTTLLKFACYELPPPRCLGGLIGDIIRPHANNSCLPPPPPAHPSGIALKDGGSSGQNHDAICCPVLHGMSRDTLPSSALMRMSIFSSQFTIAGITPLIVALGFHQIE